MSVSGDLEDSNNPKRDPLLDDFMDHDEGHEGQQASRDNEERGEDTKGENEDHSNNDDKKNDQNKSQDEEELRARRVFVGNLSFKTSWRQLKDYMKKVGNVIKVDIFEDKNGNSKGFGLVEFSTPEEAKKALTEMNQTSLDGRQIFVREDNAKNKRPGPLLVKDRKSNRRNDQSPRRSDSRRRRHSRSRSRSRSHDRDRKHRSGRPRSRSRSYSKSRSRSPRGHRRSERDDYSRRRERSRSRDEGKRRSRSRDRDRDRRSRSREDRKSSRGGGFQVIVKNMPWSVTWQQLKDAFKEYGNVLRADVPQDESGRSKGYGYVKFEKESEAIKAIGKCLKGKGIKICLGGMDGATFNGRKIVVKIYTEN